MAAALYIASFLTLAGIAVILGMRKGMLFFPVYFFLYLAVFHGLIPLLLILGQGAFFPLFERQFLLSLLTPQHYLVALLLVWTAALSFPIGWNLGNRFPIPTLGRAVRDQSEGRDAVFVAWAILVIGIAAFFMFFAAFGGVVRALEVARDFRTGAFQISNPFSFMRPLADFTKVAALLFLSLFLFGRRSWPVLIGLFISIGSALTMFVFQGGRLSLGVYVGLILVLFVSRGRLSVLRASMIALLVVILLFFGYQILFSIYSFFTDSELRIPSSIEGLAPWEFFVLELSFPAIGLATAVYAIEELRVGLRYGVDIFFGVVSIIPSRFVEFSFETTAALHNAISNPYGRGAIPVDMMTYGMYSFYIIGPAVFAFLVGFFVHVVFRYLRRIPWPASRFVLEIFFLALFVRHLVYFEPSSSINSMYFLVLCAIIVYVVSRRKSRSPKSLWMQDGAAAKSQLHSQRNLR